MCLYKTHLLNLPEVLGPEIQEPGQQFVSHDQCQDEEPRQL